jgi:hydroxyacylglutathione hydrolase
MITIKKFTFNLFDENTYILSDETGECILIDPGMSDESEENELTDFINSASLKPGAVVLTHAHIDHILGCQFAVKQYMINMWGHKDCDKFIGQAKVQASTYGIPFYGAPTIDNFLKEGDFVRFGNSELKVLHTPGHANGSLCFYSQKDKFVMSGDVLFNQSIGRTDLPTGNYDLLKYSIWEKLFTLPDETVVYAGHGPETTIGSEKISNPFVAIGS